MHNEATMCSFTILDDKAQQPPCQAVQVNTQGKVRGFRRGCLLASVDNWQLAPAQFELPGARHGKAVLFHAG
jgi:hypothetical protein